MASRNLLLLLVIFMAQHQDMGVSNPIHSPHSTCQWNQFKNLTQNFYNQALKIYNFTISTDNIVLDNVPRIQCNHRCRPEDLVSNPGTCLERISYVLSYYEDVLSTLPVNSQNEDFTQVKKTISDILKQLQDCNYKATDVTKPAKVTEDFLKMKIGSPLLSVSILIARVFSPGNPAHHTTCQKH